MFVWTLKAIRNALAEFLPDSRTKLEAVGKAIREGKDYTPVLAKVYPTLERISIDYAVMEKSRTVLVVELKCEWLDVGSWPALESVTQPDEAGNVILTDNAAMVDSSRNIVLS